MAVVRDGVFINYREEDSRSYAALLHAELSRRFGPALVFLDAQSIPAGADYVEQLLDRVRQARVVLAVIGPRWLAAVGDGGGRRIDDPADWVRRELVEAFAAGVRVIPVLTDGAPMPTEEQLPQELRPLGRCQFRQLRHRDAPADIARLAADLAEADPELAEALRRGPYSDDEVPCPYPGMVAFGPELARYFRGRDRLVARLLSRVAVQIRRGSGPLVVIGPSGVGKSSLLRAGLLPALATGNLPVAGSANWPQLYLRPGADPLAELAAHVATLGVSEQDLPAAIRTDPAALRRALRQAVDVAADTTVTPATVTAAVVGAVQTAAEIPTEVGVPVPATGPRDRRVVVVVDQLEELFTHGSTEADRLAMLRGLICATESSPGDPAPAIVLLGLRADFYAHCARIAELGPHLQDSQFLVPAMTEDEHRQAIIAPAEAVGLQVEPALTELLLAEASDHALPQLAHVLRQTFAHRTGRTLTAEGYRATGGIAQAVATTADAIYDAMNEADQKLLRRLMLALVAVVDGADDTRRRIPRAELLGTNANGDSAGERILAQLIEERLVTAENGSCMLSHEALIRAWPRLQQWLTEDRDGLRLHRELGDRARAWDRHHRDPASLYAGTELELARRWATDHSDDLRGIERDFYRASVAAETTRRRRARRRRRQLLSGLLILALTASLYGWQQRGLALQQRHAAEAALARQLAAQSDSMIDADPDLASLLAVAAYRLDPAAEERAALTSASLLPLEHRIAGHTGQVTAVAFSPDSTTLATTSNDHTTRLWNTHTGHPAATLTGHTHWVRAVAFSPDGTTLATTSNDHTTRLWNTHTGHPVATLTGHTGPVTAVAFSPDGTTLATTSWDRTARLWRIGVLSPYKQIAKICNAVGRSLTEEEWAQYLPDRQYEQICRN